MSDCELRIDSSLRSAGTQFEIRNPKFEILLGARGRTQTFNLWFVGPALYQLSYSGKRWWSELESNQPFGLFRPALIHLSYPTVKEGDEFLTPSSFARCGLCP